LDKNTCTYAARNGHLEVLKWARENGCSWNENTCTYAAKNGHLEVLKWAIMNRCPYENTEIWNWLKYWKRVKDGNSKEIKEILHEIEAAEINRKNMKI
jgi:hypothetical protein